VIAPKYMPAECPKCGSELPKRSEGCQRSGEAEIARIQSMLRKFEGFLFDRRMEGCPPERLERRVGVIAELQRCYDYLAGVPLTDT
jgi:hypothetical protein